MVEDQLAALVSPNRTHDPGRAQQASRLRGNLADLPFGTQDEHALSAREMTGAGQRQPGGQTRHPQRRREHRVQTCRHRSGFRPGQRHPLGERPIGQPRSSEVAETPVRKASDSLYAGDERRGDWPGRHLSRHDHQIDRVQRRSDNFRHIIPCGIGELLDEGFAANGLNHCCAHDVLLRFQLDHG